MSSSQSVSSLPSSTSPTGSRFSSLSESEQPVLVDEDLTTDNIGTPVDSAARVQAERIRIVLNEAIYKTMLIIALPFLVHEYETLSNILSQSDMNTLLKIFESYAKYRTELNHFFVKMTFEDIKAGQLTEKNRISSSMAHLIFILFSHPELKPKVEEIVKEGRPVCIRYLLRLMDLKKEMLKLMALSAGAQIKRKKKINKLIAANNSHIKNIADFNRIIETEQAAFEFKMRKKTEEIKQLQRELDLVNCDADNELRKIIVITDREMVAARNEHDAKIDMLKNVLHAYKEEYEAMYGSHQTEEEQARLRRIKTEQTLLDWLKKYDTDMGNRQETLDEITEKLEEEKEKCRVLEEKMVILDEEYIPLMAEREAEYQEEMTRKMNEFLEQRAARVIQRVWRTVLWNRKEKKLAIRRRIAEAREKKRQEKEDHERYMAAQRRKMV